MTSKKQKILEKINTFPYKKVFIAEDFLDLAEYETVRSTLNRLVNDGEIRRIAKGFYDKPRFITITKELSTISVDDLAQAVARKYNWSIAPSGNTALNMLGLSTQVPAKWTYVSDGRYMNFEAGDIMIEFKLRRNGNISKMPKKVSTVIQAIKQIGKENITSREIQHLKTLLSNEEKKELLLFGRTTTKWIYEIIQEISKEEVIH